MAFNRDRTVKLAEKHVRAGKILEAVAEYKKLADDNPRDMNVVNKLGDLLARAGKNKEAQRYFLRIAEFYAKDGFYLKAIAMYKKIAKSDPANLDCLNRLAGLYQQQGLSTEAKTQYLQVADQMVRMHQYEAASEVLPKVLEIEPDNLKVRMTLAELLSRTGRPREAGREFSLAARTLFDNGNSGEAIKVVRKSLTAAPGNSEVIGMLLSFVRAGEAPSPEFVAAAEEIAASDGDKPLPMALLGEVYRRSGDARRASQVLARVHEISGSPEDALTGVADIMARFLLSQKRADEAFTWLSRAVDGFAHESRPNDAAAALDDFLELCPEHRAALERRAEVAAAAGDAEAEGRALQRLAPILMGAADGERAREVVQRLLVLEPGNERYTEMLGVLEQSGGKVEEPTPAPAASDGAPEPDEAEGVGDIGSADAESIGPDSRIQEIQEADEDDGAPMDEDFVSEHLTEAEVFVKYGLLEKAKLQLQEIIDRYPRHAPSHLKLMEIYNGEGNRKKTVEECLVLVELKRSEGSQEEARELLNQAIRLDPGNPRVTRLASVIGSGAPDDGPPAASSEADEVTDDPLPPQEETVALEQETIGLEQETVAPQEEVSPSGGEGAPEESFGDLEIEIELPGETPAAAPAASVAGPSQRIEEETLDDLVITAAPEPQPPTPGDAQRPASPAAPARGRAGAEPDAEKLGEVDFYIDQGLLEEARQVIFQLQKQYPASKEVEARLARLAEEPAEESGGTAAASGEKPATGVDLEVEMALSGRKIEPERPAKRSKAAGRKPKPVFKVETPSPAAGDGDYFDLASELDQSLTEAQAELEAKEQESLEGPGHSLDDIFKAFKRGVEQQVDSEDYDTHYNLGIAYREMGLFDEAIGEFQFAARDPSRAVECCGILGLCFRDKGMPDLALQWYRKGLDLPGLEEHEAAGLRYDIAEVYRERGDFSNALEMYKEVYGVNSNYRDVATRIKEVKGRLA